MCVCFPEFVPNPFPRGVWFNFTNMYCIYCISPAVCQQCKMKPTKPLPCRVWAWERGEKGVEGGCWLAKVVSAVERDVQALSVYDSQHNAIPCRCSINSCILTCNSLWCLERILFYSKQGLPGLRSYHCFCYWVLCFSFYFSQLCPRKGFWNMFLFSTLQKSFLGWSCAKTLGTGKYPEICKDD